jgi:hypothetical protein
MPVMFSIRKITAIGRTYRHLNRYHQDITRYYLNTACR